MTKLNVILKKDFEWFCNNQEDWFEELYPTQEKKFDFYLDAVLNNDDGISNSIRTDIICDALKGIEFKNI